MCGIVGISQIAQFENAIRYRVAVGPLLDLTDAELLQQELSGQYEVEARLMAFSN